MSQCGQPALVADDPDAVVGLENEVRDRIESPRVRTFNADDKSIRIFAQSAVANIASDIMRVGTERQAVETKVIGCN